MAKPISDPFTHYFTFDTVDEFIIGRVEFDTDKKMTFRVVKTSSPLSEDTLKLFMEWLDLMKRIYGKFGHIQRVSVVEAMAATEPLSAVVEEQITPKLDVKPK